MGSTLEFDDVKTRVELIFPIGFGYGEGSISVKKQLKNGELSRASLDMAIDIVLNDTEVFVDVDAEANDDGCGDGRITSGVYRVLDPLTRKIERYNKSLRRSKLFGGGLILAASMWRAIEGPNEDRSLEGDRIYIAALLKKHGIHFGAHSAIGQNGVDCGCGAIDNYELISHNTMKYKEQILNTCKSLYSDEFDNNMDALNHVFDTYECLSGTYFVGTSGKDTMTFIEAQGAVVKELTGEHKEDMVVINDVIGTTFDQEALRHKLSQKGLSSDIQAFVVDVWRGRMYADFIADRASEQGHNRLDAFKLAYADFLIRTLAVSATLSAGDQAVILRSVTQ